jgi:hypothetical protein
MRMPLNEYIPPNEKALKSAEIEVREREKQHDPLQSSPPPCLEYISLPLWLHQTIRWVLRDEQWTAQTLMGACKVVKCLEEDYSQSL